MADGADHCTHLLITLDSAAGKSSTKAFVASLTV